MTMEYLEARYDARASFYNKASVVTEDNGDKTLFSYNTKVATIKNGKPTILNYGEPTQTTTRHIKEFLLQNGFEAESRNQMESDYMEEALDVGLHKFLKKVDNCNLVTVETDGNIKEVGSIDSVKIRTRDMDIFNITREDMEFFIYFTNGDVSKSDYVNTKHQLNKFLFMCICELEESNYELYQELLECL